MPWTFAHPAAILPLRRLPLPFAGLVIGSLVPDFGYYIGFYQLSLSAHSALGLLTHCLPAGLLLVSMLRWVRRAAIELLPQPHRAALSELLTHDEPTNARGWLLTCVALIVGAATHVLWDAFTHGNNAIVGHIAALQLPVIRLASKTFYVYEVLQHASSLIGVTCLAIAYSRWLARRGVAASLAADRADGLRRVLLLVCIAVSLTAAAWVAVRWPTLPFNSPHAPMLVRTVIYSTSLFFGLFLLAASLWPRINPARR